MVNICAQLAGTERYQYIQRPPTPGNSFWIQTWSMHYLVLQLHSDQICHHLKIRMCWRPLMPMAQSNIGTLHLDKWWGPLARKTCSFYISLIHLMGNCFPLAPVTIISEYTTGILTKKCLMVRIDRRMGLWAIQIEYFAQSFTPKIKICWSVEDGMIVFWSGILDRPILFDQFFNPGFVVMLLILMIRDQQFWLAPTIETRIYKYLNSFNKLWNWTSGELVDSIQWNNVYAAPHCLLYSAQFSKDKGLNHIDGITGNNRFILAGGSGGANEVRMFSTESHRVCIFNVVAWISRKPKLCRLLHLYK